MYFNPAACMAIDNSMTGIPMIPKTYSMPFGPKRKNRVIGKSVECDLVNFSPVQLVSALKSHCHQYLPFSWHNELKKPSSIKKICQVLSTSSKLFTRTPMTLQAIRSIVQLKLITIISGFWIFTQVQVPNFENLMIVDNLL
jgi:hypothetical protein